MPAALQKVSSAQLRIESRFLSHGVVQLAVIGEIDLATTEELQASLFDVISAPIPYTIDVDLDGVTFLDCVGLSVLVIAKQAAARAGRRLRITKPRPLIRYILETTGLLGVLTAYPTGLDDDIGDGPPLLA